MAAFAYILNSPRQSRNDKIGFERPIYYLGVLSSSSPKKISLAIRNTTAHAVIINEVHPSCSCTDAVIADGHLAPGDIATVSATIHTEGKEGFVAVEIIAVTNDLNDKFIATKVVAWVAPADGIIVGSSNLEFTDDSPADLIITGPAHALKSLTVKSFDNDLQLHFGTIFPLPHLLFSNMPGNDELDQMKLRITSKYTGHSPKRSQITLTTDSGSTSVPINWSPLEEFSCIPGSLFLGITDKETPLQGTFLLRNTAKIVSAPTNMKLVRDLIVQKSYSRYTVMLTPSLGHNILGAEKINIKDGDVAGQLPIYWYKE